MQRRELEGLSREELVERAERLGVARPRVLTQPELIDELVSRTTTSARERARARGWLGRARDLIAGVIERGLHLPDVARALRATPHAEGWPTPPPPLPTITLAEIYAAQGHLDRALGVLDEVLAREPEHPEARGLRTRLSEQSRHGKGRSTVRDGSSGSTQRDGLLSSIPPPPVEHAAPTNGASEVAASSGAGATPHTRREASAAPTPAAKAEADAAVSIAADADVPLPERYDVDEVVAIAVDPSTVYLYWEVRPTTLARARERRSTGVLTVRVLSVTASWDGPLVDTRDLRVDPLFGDLFVRDLPPGASVRVSIGWLGDPTRTGEDAFEPFAVGLEIAAPRGIRAEPGALDVARWAPHIPEPRAGALAGGTRHVVGTALSRMERGLVAPASTRRTAFGALHPAHDRGRRDDVGVSRPAVTRVRSWTASRAGSSELYVEESREVFGGAGPWRWGGASELARGGASELARGGASELSRSKP